MLISHSYKKLSHLKDISSMHKSDWLTKSIRSHVNISFLQEVITSQIYPLWTKLTVLPSLLWCHRGKRFFSLKIIIKLSIIPVGVPKGRNSMVYCEWWANILSTYFWKKQYTRSRKLVINYKGNTLEFDRYLPPYCHVDFIDLICQSLLCIEGTSLRYDNFL